MSGSGYQGGSGSRVRPVWPRNPVMRLCCRWMRSSWFRIAAASWDGVSAARLPRPSFITDQAPSKKINSPPYARDVKLEPALSYACSVDASKTRSGRDLSLCRYCGPESFRARKVHPPPCTPRADGDGDQREEFFSVNAVIAMTNDRLVKVVGGHHGQGRCPVPEVGLEPRRVQEPERHVQVLAKDTLPVMVHLPCVNHGPQPQDSRLVGR